jgi:putative endonuclease
VNRSQAQDRAGRKGQAAEWLAAAYLMAKGYRILARRYGGKGGEIDLIARRGKTVIFVEVKARAAMQAAETAISTQKAMLVSRRVSNWLARNPWANGHDLRADAVFLAPRSWPRHVTQVFELQL